MTLANRLTEREKALLAYFHVVENDPVIRRAKGVQATAEALLSCVQNDAVVAVSFALNGVIDRSKPLVSGLSRFFIGQALERERVPQSVRNVVDGAVASGVEEVFRWGAGAVEKVLVNAQKKSRKR